MTHKATKLEAGVYEYRGEHIERTDSGRWNVGDFDTTDTLREAKRCVDWNLDTEFNEGGSPK